MSWWKLEEFLSWFCTLYFTWHLLCYSSGFVRRIPSELIICLRWCAVLAWLYLSFLSSTSSWFWITFADNSIEDIPPSICNLIHLKSLCLDNNNVNQVFTIQFKSYWTSLIMYSVVAIISYPVFFFFLFHFPFVLHVYLYMSWKNH